MPFWCHESQWFEKQTMWKVVDNPKSVPWCSVVEFRVPSWMRKNAAAPRTILPQKTLWFHKCRMHEWMNQQNEWIWQMPHYEVAWDRTKWDRDRQNKMWSIKWRWNKARKSCKNHHDDWVRFSNEISCAKQKSLPFKSWLAHNWCRKAWLSAGNLHGSFKQKMQNENGFLADYFRVLSWFLWEFIPLKWPKITVQMQTRALSFDSFCIRYVSFCSSHQHPWQDKGRGRKSLAFYDLDLFESKHSSANPCKAGHSMIQFTSIGFQGSNVLLTLGPIPFST